MSHEAPKSHKILSKDRILWEVGGFFLKSKITSSLGRALVEASRERVMQSVTRAYVNSMAINNPLNHSRGEHAPF